MFPNFRAVELCLISIARFLFKDFSLQIVVSMAITSNDLTKKGIPLQQETEFRKENLTRIRATNDFFYGMRYNVDKNVKIYKTLHF